jgi:hypothetical protein
MLCRREVAVIVVQLEFRLQGGRETVIVEGDEVAELNGTLFTY